MVYAEMLKLHIRNGEKTPIIDTLKFARMFKIRHYKILKKCDEILSVAEKMDISLNEHFIYKEYNNESDKKYYKYELTHRGYLILLMEASAPKNEYAKKKLFINRQQVIDILCLLAEDCKGGIR